MSKPDLKAARVAWNAIGQALDNATDDAYGNWRHTVAVAMDAMSRALAPTNESVLALAVRDVLAQWDRGDLYKAAFEDKMRETICHFARVYVPIPADLEKLALVGKLAYQFKLRHQGFILGGTKIQPFWDAIDDLPSKLLNDAHREMEDEIATWKTERPR